MDEGQSGKCVYVDVHLAALRWVDCDLPSRPASCAGTVNDLPRRLHASDGREFALAFGANILQCSSCH
jgi:hypothetical protein